jgi:hypothetical protein
MDKTIEHWTTLKRQVKSARENEIMDNVTLHAHFDGEQIRLDDPFELQPNTRLLITVLTNGQSESDHEELPYLSRRGLAQAYGDNEPEYSSEMIKEVNPEYEGM